MKKRIHLILAGRIPGQLNFARKLVLALAAVAVFATPIAVGMMNMPRSGLKFPEDLDQSEIPALKPDTTPGQRPSFDVASIKLSPRGSSSDFKLWVGPGSHMILSHVTIELLIKWSYRIRDNQLIGGPDWLHKQLFDIDAKCDPPVGGDPRTLNAQQRQAYEEEMLKRLQSLLADRFDLRLRPETRDLPVYELVLAKKGPKFQESPKPAPDEKIKQGSIVRPGHIEIYHGPIDIIDRILSQASGQIVVDRTGLTGFYDLSLDWAPNSAAPPPNDPDAGNSRASADASGPSFFTAVQEQLGLRLKSAKGPVPVLVVESASLPQPN